MRVILNVMIAPLNPQSKHASGITYPHLKNNAQENPGSRRVALVKLEVSGMNAGRVGDALSNVYTCVVWRAESSLRLSPIGHGFFVA